MRVLYISAILTLVLPSQSLLHAAERKNVGNWFVEIEKDPFSSKKKTIVGNASGGNVMAIRCFPDEGLSVLIIAPGVSSNDYEKGASVTFRYRADEGTIVDDKGYAFGPKAAALPNARQILQDALKATTLYLRVETPDGTLTDMAFHTKGAQKALAQVGTDCPAEADAPPDEKK